MKDTNNPILLIVESEEEYLMLKKLLQTSDHLSNSLHWAKTHSDGLKKASTYAYMLIIIDFHQDVDNGMELIQALKDKEIHTPIIVLTDENNENLGVQAIKYGADDYLLKDQITPYLLERSIRYASERHRNKQQIHAKEKKKLIRTKELFLASILDSLSAHIAVIDENARVIKINKAWEEFAFPRSKIDVPEQLSEGQNYLELLTKSNKAYQSELPKVLEGVKNVLNGTREEFHLEFDTNMPTGKKWFLLQVTPLQGETGGAVISHTDITRRVELEHIKDEFLSVASHELKTPLTTIKGYVQLIEKHIAKDKNYKLLRYIQQANRYADKLHHLIINLLDMSRIQAGMLTLQKERVQLQPFIADVIDSMNQLSSNHSIVFSSHTDVSVNIDQERIEQVMMNLLSNATKYSPHESTVSVDLKKDTESVIVSITDQGIGVPKDQQTHLFQRFFRVPDATKNIPGLGIGLFISAEIIKRHEGKIWMESHEGNGSTFYFSIPLK